MCCMPQLSQNDTARTAAILIRREDAKTPFTARVMGREEITFNLVAETRMLMDTYMAPFAHAAA